MKKTVVLKSGRRCFPGSKMFARFSILLSLVISMGCAGPGYFAGKDVTLEHFTKREIAASPYKIVQDKKNFYIVHENPDQNPAGKPQVSEYRLLKGSFMGVASDNQANMITRLIAESHNLLDADLKTASDGISASIHALSSSTENKFLTIDSRTSALESKIKELASSVGASSDKTKKEMEAVSRDIQKAVAEVLSLKTKTGGMPSEIVILFPKGKHTLSSFEEERFVRFLDNFTHHARKRKLYFAILGRDTDLFQKRTASLAFIIDRYLSESPHEIKASTDHEGQRDKDTILVGAATDPDQLPKSKETNTTGKINAVPKEESTGSPESKHITIMRDTTQSAPVNPVKEKKDKALTRQDKPEKTLGPIPVVSVPMTEKVFSPVLPTDHASKEQIKGQGTKSKEDKNDDQNDPNIEELRQILMDSGKRKK